MNEGMNDRVDNGPGRAQGGRQEVAGARSEETGAQTSSGQTASGCQSQHQAPEVQIPIM